MKTLDAPRAWNLTTIHRMLMEGFKEGAKLAATDVDVRKAACDASELEEAFAGVTRRAAEQAAWRLSDSIATDFPDRWAAGIEPVITAATQAALVLGARAIASVEGQSWADLASLAEDELWLAPHVDRLLVQAVEAILSVGFPLPGARSFLQRVCPPQEPEIWTARGGTSPELRTGWIRDADSGRSYQWCVRREADRLHLSRRLRGSRRAEVTVSIAVYDVAVIKRLLLGAATQFDQP